MEKNIPQHVAIIMDGNGRWAKKRGLARSFGHMEGAKSLRRRAMSCGVVTTTEPVTGIFCDRVSWMSPVPGGRSMKR